MERVRRSRPRGGAGTRTAVDGFAFGDVATGKEGGEEAGIGKPQGRGEKSGADQGQERIALRREESGADTPAQHVEPQEEVILE